MFKFAKLCRELLKKLSANLIQYRNALYLVFVSAFKVYANPFVHNASCVLSSFRVNQLNGLACLGLVSLELNRLRYDVLIIVLGMTDHAAKNVFTLTSSLHSVNTRGHAFKL